MRECDYLIDIGLGAGVYGGNVIASGVPSKVYKNDKSITAQYLNGTKKLIFLVKEEKVMILLK